jgi:hypothetical protein
MIEAILMTVMAASLIGMVATGFNDPLSQRFWEQWRR